MAAARMIGMAMRDQRARLGLRRIDPCIGGGHVNALGVGFDPGTETRHPAYMVRRA